MDFSKTHYLKTLLVFENTINKELIRSLHVYGIEDGEEEEVERAFILKREGPYVEMAANPILRLFKFHPPEVFQGKITGLWLCIFAFHSDRLPRFSRIPPLLSISRNAKLESIPNLANDLREVSRFSSGVSFNESEDDEKKSSRSAPVLDLDLNSLPDSVCASEFSETQRDERSTAGMAMDKKKKRATSKDIARIAMEDLAKYFDVPIVEASRCLNVGVTVLKKKCRELGIPRWPHRKIKSLDGLIRNLQEEGAQWQQEDKAAAFAVAKRRMMLEMEKENIERKPFIELQRETKQFRQDIFKRRHKARALKKQCL